MKTVVETVIAGVASLSIGCAKSSDTPTVSASLVVTGSSQASILANYKIQHPWLSIFMPSAVAFPAPAMVDSTGLNVPLSTSWIVIKEIEFKATETAGAAESADVEFNGPYVVGPAFSYAFSIRYS